MWAIFYVNVIDGRWRKIGVGCESIFVQTYSIVVVGGQVLLLSSPQETALSSCAGESGQVPGGRDLAEHVVLPQTYPAFFLMERRGKMKARAKVRALLGLDVSLIVRCSNHGFLG